MIRRTTKRKARARATSNDIIDPELEWAMLNDPGGGLSYNFHDDLAFWRNEGEWDNAWTWVDAIYRLDRLGDKKPLTDLLRSGRELPPKAREHLADLIERGVPSPRGRPRTPSYQLSEADARLMTSVMDVKDWVKYGGMSVEDAVDRVSKDRGLAFETLEYAYKGKNRSFSKSKKRL